MLDSKLIQSLCQLSSKDLRNFHDFVHSPFFNKHKLTTQLFDYLYPRLEEKKELEKDIVYQHLFPNSKFTDFKLSNLMSYLTDLLNKYLAQKTYQKKQTYWVDNLEMAQEHNMEDLIKINYRKAKKALGKHKIKDAEYFWTQSKLDKLYDKFLTISLKKRDSKLLKSSIFALDQFYYIEKLKHWCEVFEWGRINNELIDSKEINRLKVAIEENWSLFEENILLKTYYRVLMILLEENEERHYEYLVATLEKDFKKYSKAEIKYPV